MGVHAGGAGRYAGGWRSCSICFQHEGTTATSSPGTIPGRAQCAHRPRADVPTRRLLLLDERRRAAPVVVQQVFELVKRIRPVVSPCALSSRTSAVLPVVNRAYLLEAGRPRSGDREMLATTRSGAYLGV